MFKIMAVLVPLVSFYRLMAVLADPNHSRTTFRLLFLMKMLVFLLNLALIALFERLDYPILKKYANIFRFLFVLEELVVYNLVVRDILPSDTFVLGNVDAEIAMLLVLDHIMNYNTFMFNLVVQTPTYYTLIALYYF